MFTISLLYFNSVYFFLHCIGNWAGKISTRGEQRSSTIVDGCRSFGRRSGEEWLWLTRIVTVLHWQNSATNYHYKCDGVVQHDRTWWVRFQAVSRRLSSVELTLEVNVIRPEEKVNRSYVCCAWGEVNHLNWASNHAAMPEVHSSTPRLSRCQATTAAVLVPEPSSLFLKKLEQQHYDIPPYVQFIRRV